jgi:hypothetical protein
MAAKLELLLNQTKRKMTFKIIGTSASLLCMMIRLIINNGKGPV